MTWSGCWAAMGTLSVWFDVPLSASCVLCVPRGWEMYGSLTDVSARGGGLEVPRMSPQA